ncbi:Piwi-domain-containing protein [Pluteus cervinus]|uniref:Piwi-domain-containing protein n=1 Tax=Pluteus cervinus TaxID=181527 RepID=A0ACD3AV02_9AGAR|nr:Piwi-domain-containing protein [Pluteus cervinus]
MPPRSNPKPKATGGGSRQGSTRGGAGAGDSSRGGVGSLLSAPSAGSHITTVGVKRPNFGTNGRAVDVVINAYPVTIPQAIIHHYDVVIEPDAISRVKVLLIRELQEVVAPQVFTPKAAYDGQKNIFAARELSVGPGSFDVSLPGGRPSSSRPPTIYKIKLTKVQEINPELLQRFSEGKQSQDNAIQTALTALNVVVRMAPLDLAAHPPPNSTDLYTFDARSIYINKETQRIGGGIELWRGYFQSIRPTIGRMIINIDIATGTMYKPGTLISLALDFLGRPNDNPNTLSPKGGLRDQTRLLISRFLSGLRIFTPHTEKGREKGKERMRSIKKVSKEGADAITFEKDGKKTTVAQYFKGLNMTLKHPSVICVEVGKGAWVPLELCMVPPGQIMRKEVPPELKKSVLNFATKKPAERLQIIKRGLPVIDKQLYSPSRIRRWVVVVYTPRNWFNDQNVGNLVQGLISNARKLGIIIDETDPLCRWENAQGNVQDHLSKLGKASVDKNGGQGPDLIVAVLPDSGNVDIYTRIKHFGDIRQGVATQCLLVNKAKRANDQYWANVLLKINVKLGGMNVIPDPAASAVLTSTPTLVIGADVIHPPPGVEDGASFTAVVGNVDANAVRYVSSMKVQTGRKEIIEDLKDMVKHLITNFKDYQQAKEGKPAGFGPKRIIFYRDGVSEGQFSHVLEQELPLIKAACKETGVDAKITLIVVGKRHHIRFIPVNAQLTDDARRGNCSAGTVVDQGIGHPTEFDYYLLSHGALLGTSRPSHYSVLYDDNGFNADSVQALSFALCHVFARATRSVSIPAPVYYADIVCARNKIHYDPAGAGGMSETGTLTSTQIANALESKKRGFLALHQNQSKLMYFS